MSGTIGGLSASTGGARPPVLPAARPDPAELADKAFRQIDKAGKGYINKADLEAAFARLSTSSDAAQANAPSADDVIRAFDTTGDGQVTKDEFSAGLQKLTEQFDAQFNRARTSGAGSGAGASGAVQGGPPPAAGAGKAASSETADSTDTATTIYDPADANQDGTVTQQESLAYQRTMEYMTLHAAEIPEGAAQDPTAGVMRRILELVQAYGQTDGVFQTAQSAHLDLVA